MENYKDKIESLPPNAQVFPILDGNEEFDNTPGQSVMKYIESKGFKIVGVSLEFNQNVVSKLV